MSEWELTKRVNEQGAKMRRLIHSYQAASEFYAANYDSISTVFHNEWVAVLDGAVLESSPSHTDLSILLEGHELGGGKPYIAHTSVNPFETKYHAHPTNK